MIICRYNKKQVEKYKNEKEKLKLAKEGLRYSELFTLTNEGSFSWFDCSADNGYEVCEGNQSLVWKKVGYKTILDILMRSYPDPNKKLPIDDKIHLNTKVQSISWNKSESVTVLTIDNSSYFADHVIFTPSIGVLKQQSDKLFTPSLPSAKREAIEATGFGGVIKIFVHFPTKWWKDDHSFSFFWSEEDLHVDYPHGPRKSGISWITQLVDLEQNINNPNVWSVWFAGDLVPEVEKLPIDVLKNGCEFVFNKFLGKNYNVTAIDQIVRSTWYTNPNFLGAYSFTKTGLYRPDLSYQEVLAEPLNGVEGKPAVLFAGEATNPVHFSTVHGAIETGHREAERIIKLYKRKQ
jgi:spermine oxidase